jgi:hypothetical protein
MSRGMAALVVANVLVWTLVGVAAWVFLGPTTVPMY